MIYSANYGRWDPDRRQPVQLRMFTETTHPLGLMARYIDRQAPKPRHHAGAPETQSRLDAKWWKLRPDLAMPGEEITVWMDASVTILERDFEALAIAELGDDDALFMPHPWRDCIYDECEASKVGHKYAGQPIDEQCARYREAGHPEHWGLFQTTVLVRRDNERTRALNDAWWQEIIDWSIQDQLSLPPLVRVAPGLRWHTWPVNPIAAGWLRWGSFNA